MKRPAPRCATLAMLSLAAAAPAQVPDGYFVVSGARFQRFLPGIGGLFYVHPRDAMVAAIPVTGLPASLTGAGVPTNAVGGANCVLRRPTDETLFAGEAQPAGVQVHLHALRLSGSANTGQSSQLVVGTSISSQGGGIQSLALLPNGDVLVAVTALSSQPPLNGAILGIATTSPSLAVRPLNLQPLPPGIANAVAVEPTGTRGYVAMWLSQSSSNILEVDLATGAAASIGSTSFGVTCLVHDGARLLAGGGGTQPGSGQISELRHTLTGWRVTPVASPIGSYPPLNGLAIEPATGGVAGVGVQIGGWSRAHISRFDASFRHYPLNASIGQSFFTDVDGNPNPEAYGTQSAIPPGAPYRWQVAPNPGGLPTVGNGAFGVRVARTVGVGHPGFWLASTARGNPMPMPGIGTLWIDLARVVATGLVPSHGGLALPIPGISALIGLRLDLQTVHAHSAAGASWFEAADGLELTIM